MEDGGRPISCISFVIRLINVVFGMVCRLFGTTFAGCESRELIFFIKLVKGNTTCEIEIRALVEREVDDVRMSDARRYDYPRSLELG